MAGVRIMEGLTSKVRGDALQRGVPLDCGVRRRSRKGVHATQSMNDTPPKTREPTASAHEA